MRAFHDSRNLECRAPYGAVRVGVTVALSLRVWDAPDAAVQLRTWVDGVGETLYDMPRVAGDECDGGNPDVFQLAYAAERPGVVWYQFVIALPNGERLRYGAREGATGGSGRVTTWEPPSFQLTVYDDHTAPQVRGECLQLDILTAFLRGERSAWDVAETLEGWRENLPIGEDGWPAHSLASYGTTRLAMLLGGAPDPEHLPEAEHSRMALDEGQSGLAKGRLWCAGLLHMLMAGQPKLYHSSNGDSLAQPDGGTPFPRETDYADCQVIVQNLVDMRHSLPLFETSGVSFFAANDDVVGLWRYGIGEEAACVLLNRSLQNSYDVLVPQAGEAVSDIIAGYGVPIVSENDHPNALLCARASGTGNAEAEPAGTKRYAQAHLHQLGAAVLYFHPAQRLQKPMGSGLGVLAHITSLPTSQASTTGKHPATSGQDVTDALRTLLADAGLPLQLGAVTQQAGTLGPRAYSFVDWLADANVRYWQVLPVNPTDDHGSPYAGISAFAGNVRLLDGSVASLAEELSDIESSERYRAFCKREADWLDPYATFMAIRHAQGKGIAWQDWPDIYRHFPTALEDRDLSTFAEAWKRMQFAFDQQWQSLRTYANERGVQVIGDMPIYVSADSADVWTHPELFQLDAAGRPALVAGCPPDAFAEDGQVWGNPVYDWQACESDGYSWWMRRLKRAFDLYDFVRLDHFIGFARYYSIPTGKPASAGMYRPGPGLGFFREAYDRFGPLPIIAEDLGLITPAVRALVAACGFSGMDVIQFADGNDPLSGYNPRPEKIVYTGTHDNQTLVGYARKRYGSDDARRVAETLMDRAVDGGSPTCIVPLQDVLMLDDEARMNTPGTTEGNWTWRATWTDIQSASERLCNLGDRLSTR